MTEKQWCALFYDSLYCACAMRQNFSFHSTFLGGRGIADFEASLTLTLTDVEMHSRKVEHTIPNGLHCSIRIRAPFCPLKDDLFVEITSQDIVHLNLWKGVCEMARSCAGKNGGRETRTTKKVGFAFIPRLFRRK